LPPPAAAHRCAVLYRAAAAKSKQFVSKDVHLQETVFEEGATSSSTQAIHIMRFSSSLRKARKSSSSPLAVTFAHMDEWRPIFMDRKC
jgi:hypothetical protein